MKRTIMALCLLWGVAYGQTTGYLRYDTVRIQRGGGNSELYIENATRGVTGGVLTNVGGGRTAFLMPASAGWGLTGNTGTTDVTNFVGTTDVQDFVLKAGGQEGIRIFSGSGPGGSSNIASVSIGPGNNSISSDFAMAIGQQNTIGSSAETAIAIGESNNITSVNGTAIGIINDVSGNAGSTAIGSGLKSKSSSGVVVGQYNDSTNAADANLWNALNRAFQVGIGSANNARANAMTVLFNGRVGIGKLVPTEILDVTGNVRFSGALMPNNTAGTSGQVLTSAGAGSVPTWQTPSGGSQTPWTSNINADGFTLFGNDGSGQDLTLGSTSHATKGKILIGTSAYDEVNNRLGIGTASPSDRLHVAGVGAGAGVLVTGTTSPSLILKGGGSPAVYFQDGGGTSAVLYMNASYNVVLGLPGWGTPILFTEQATNRMGVNNITPTAQLDVTGTFTTSGVNTLSNLAGATNDRGVVASTAGVLSAGPIIASGTYTPTLTNVTNITGSTAYECQYLRVGNTVTVSGKVDIDVTLGAASELGMTLPIASNMTAEQNLGGTGSSAAAASLVSAIRADATNDRAAFVFTAVSLTNDSYFFEFTYQIK